MLGICEYRMIKIGIEYNGNLRIRFNEFNILSLEFRNNDVSVL